ncbi:pp-loop family protein [Cyclospora cayetanensis]|uniref:Pp-loop family protein n=1 Tax=Cyclospora cayetanensis TaxID=88456 RepID=A0A1D3D368_9EIME|nr:pp-loop family protein [Cyclospora cayetanensis]
MSSSPSEAVASVPKRRKAPCYTRIRSSCRSSPNLSCLHVGNVLHANMKLHAGGVSRQPRQQPVSASRTSAVKLEKSCFLWECVFRSARGLCGSQVSLRSGAPSSCQSFTMLEALNPKDPNSGGAPEAAPPGGAPQAPPGGGPPPSPSKAGSPRQPSLRTCQPDAQISPAKVAYRGAPNEGASRRCGICRSPRVCMTRLNGAGLRCKECFCAEFEKEVWDFISEESLLPAGSRVCVCVSGGKDSAVLLHVLHLLNAQREQQWQLLLLAIDEGIQGYRDRALETVAANSADYALPLTVLSYADLYKGWTMDEIHKAVTEPTRQQQQRQQQRKASSCSATCGSSCRSTTSGARSSRGGPDVGSGSSSSGKKEFSSYCTYCGVFRRQAFERGALSLGADCLVTGHNLDDCAETALLNLVRGDAHRLRSSANFGGSGVLASGAEGSKSGGIEGSERRGPPHEGSPSVRRCKPLLRSFQKEIVLYAHFRRLKHFATECTYSFGATRGKPRELLASLQAALQPQRVQDIVRAASAWLTLPAQTHGSKSNDAASWSLLSAAAALSPGASSASPELVHCEECGARTTNSLCRACSLVRLLENKTAHAVSLNARKVKGLRRLQRQQGASQNKIDQIEASSSCRSQLHPRSSSAVSIEAAPAPVNVSASRESHRGSARTLRGSFSAPSIQRFVRRSTDSLFSRGGGKGGKEEAFRLLKEMGSFAGGKSVIAAPPPLEVLLYAFGECVVREGCLGPTEEGTLDRSASPCSVSAYCDRAHPYAVPRCRHYVKLSMKWRPSFPPSLALLRPATIPQGLRVSLEPFKPRPRAIRRQALLHARHNTSHEEKGLSRAAARGRPPRLPLLDRALRESGALNAKHDACRAPPKGSVRLFISGAVVMRMAASLGPPSPGPPGGPLEDATRHRSIQEGGASTAPIDRLPADLFSSKWLPSWIRRQLLQRQCVSDVLSCPVLHGASCGAGPLHQRKQRMQAAHASSLQLASPMETALIRGPFRALLPTFLPLQQLYVPRTLSQGEGTKNGLSPSSGLTPGLQRLHAQQQQQRSAERVEALESYIWMLAFDPRDLPSLRSVDTEGWRFANEAIRRILKALELLSHAQELPSRRGGPPLPESLRPWLLDAAVCGWQQSFNRRLQQKQLHEKQLEVESGCGEWLAWAESGSGSGSTTRGLAASSRAAGEETLAPRYTRISPAVAALLATQRRAVVLSGCVSVAEVGGEWVEYCEATVMLPPCGSSSCCCSERGTCSATTRSDACTERPLMQDLQQRIQISLRRYCQQAQSTLQRLLPPWQQQKSMLLPRDTRGASRGKEAAHADAAAAAAFLQACEQQQRDSEHLHRRQSLAALLSDCSQCVVYDVVASRLLEEGSVCAGAAMARGSIPRARTAFARPPRHPVGGGHLCIHLSERQWLEALTHARTWELLFLCLCWGEAAARSFLSLFDSLPLAASWDGYLQAFPAQTRWRGPPRLSGFGDLACARLAAETSAVSEAAFFLFFCETAHGCIACIGAHFQAPHTCSGSSNKTNAASASPQTLTP